MPKHLTPKMYTDICHNINNPLTVIINYSRETEVSAKEMNAMFESAARIADYVKSLEEHVQKGVSQDESNDKEGSM